MKLVPSCYYTHLHLPPLKVGLSVHDAMPSARIDAEALFLLKGPFYC